MISTASLLALVGALAFFLTGSCATAQRTPALSPMMSPTVRVTESQLRAADAKVGSRRARLSSIKQWLYFIDMNIDEGTLERMADSSHQMVVMDVVRSEKKSDSAYLARTVERLHKSKHPKLVIAYIDIGQAESFRPYWNRNWRVGNPDWIVADDPDGWKGNYPVAYWRDEWKQIWLGEKGILREITDAGFDGVYLDWVEAYSDTRVEEAARRAKVNPQDEIVRWVGDIARHGRARNPEFMVIAQNAAELAERDDYLRIIDAISQEQTWFDGASDNDPPGDCPLPRTRGEVGSATYLSNLPKKCRAMHDKFQESTLHMSSEQYLEDLKKAHDKGTPIFTVDYAVQPKNVKWIVETSRRHGFTPFVGPRALNQFVPPQE